MITKRQLQTFDFLLVLLVFCIVIFGIVIIGSATRINIYGPKGEFQSQMIWFATGTVLMLAAAFIDYRTISRFYVVLYGINIFLLILVLLFGGDDGTGVKRWIFGIQPSEFSKVFMIIYLSKFIDKNREKIDNISILFAVFVSTLIPFLLIKEQPSLSASLVTLAIMITLLFAGRISYKYIFIALAVIIPIAIVIIIDLHTEEHKLLSMFLEPYHIRRLTTAVNPDLSSPDYYQTKNSIWAIGSGELRGKGLYQGTINQLSYLPESHNDFIFSVIGEEFGFLGCVSVLVLMLLIIARCLYIAAKAMDNLGKLIASGVAGMLAFQTFVNVGVATGLLPNTGMPFPFLSYGGSSMWINMISIGLVLNVGMRKPKSIFEG